MVKSPLNSPPFGEYIFVILPTTNKSKAMIQTPKSLEKVRVQRVILIQAAARGSVDLSWGGGQLQIPPCG